MSDKPHTITNKGEIISLSKPTKDVGEGAPSCYGCLFWKEIEDGDGDTYTACIIQANVMDKDMHETCEKHPTHVWEHVTVN